MYDIVESGKRIASLRKNAGYMQEQFGEKIGLSYRSIADIERVQAGHETEAKRPVFRVGLYARLSFESGANRERSTIETQMELLKKFVDQTTDIVVEKEYVDISKTGTDFERSGFDEMMQDVRSSRINCIIVKDLSSGV